MGNEKNAIIVLILIGIVFFFIYSAPLYQAQPKFTSPDETANYFFITQFQDSLSLRFYNQLYGLGEGITHPRSTIVQGGFLIPASFIGMIMLYGAIAKVFGSFVILFLTPALAVLAAIIIFLLLKRVFHTSVAFLTAILLLLHPGYWYYATRGMFHNVAFLVFFLLSLYLILRAFEKKNNLILALSGIVFGVSLSIRTVEFFWTSVIILIILIVAGKKGFWQNVLYFAGGAAIVLIPYLFILWNLFGGMPYQSYFDDSLSISTSGAGNSFLTQVGKILFPFGVHFAGASERVLDYFIRIFPLFSIFFGFGLFLTIKKFVAERRWRLEFLYTFLFFFMGIWLFLYYGSWEFYEYIDRTKIILGSSYIRYWLPVSLFSLPFCAIGILKVVSYLRSFRWRVFAISIVLSAFVFTSFHIVLLDPLQGIFALREYANQNKQKAEAVVERTPKDSVIIAGASDKVFFPERQVIVSLPAADTEKVRLIQSLLAKTLVYYYYAPTDPDFASLQQLLGGIGVTFKEIISFPNNERLLKLAS